MSPKSNLPTWVRGEWNCDHYTIDIPAIRSPEVDKIDVVKRRGVFGLHDYRCGVELFESVLRISSGMDIGEFIGLPAMTPIF